MIASLIFFPTKEYSALPTDYGLAYEEVRVKTSDNIELTGWFLPATSSSKALYFLHGNAGNISDRLFKIKEWVSRGYSVFLLDYRSYGTSNGKITSEEDLYQDAKAGLKWLQEVRKMDSRNILLYGESIGCALVLELAQDTKENFLGIILEAPFTSLSEVTKVHYPFVPTAILGSFQFDNLRKISNVKIPTFIIHGEQDEICPFWMGEALFKKLTVSQKELFNIPNGMHNNLTDVAGSKFYDRPIRFIKNCHPEA